MVSYPRQIQETLETLYNGIGGKYFYGDSAWQYIKDYTGIDLLEILENGKLIKQYRYTEGMEDEENT